MSAALLERMAGAPAARRADIATRRAPAVERLRLLASSRDEAGLAELVRRVTGDLRATPVGCQSFVEPATGWSHRRIEFDLSARPLSPAEVRRAVAPLLEREGLCASIGLSNERKRVVVMVSKSDHCLRELIARQHSGELAIEIAGVISNHEDLCGLAVSHGLPFHHLPMSAGNRDAALERAFELFAELRGDLMVLARFMQILPPAFCQRLPGRIINIHHSLLPAFVGARAYHQAWERGVKTIGATAHYVTADLDQGPIIEQETTRVDHAQSVEDLTRLGSDLERRVLAAGVAAHADDRVIVSGARTIVFSR